MTRQEKAPTRQRRGGEVNRNGRSQYRPNLSPLESVLPLLSGVRKNGDGYRANCPNPAHGDNSTKGTLAVSQGREGQLLLHCFSCADVRGILNGLGLELADLFPDRPKDMTPEGRREARAAFKRNAWAAALRVLSREASIIYYAGRMFMDGETLTEQDAERVRLAIARIDNAREVLA